MALVVPARPSYARRRRSLRWLLRLYYAVAVVAGLAADHVVLSIAFACAATGLTSVQVLSAHRRAGDR